MIHPARSPLRVLRRALVLPILLAACWSVAGCAQSVSPTQPPAASPLTEPSLTPVPGGSTAATPRPAGQPPTQTDTEWGRIWDGLPPWFPLARDSVPTESREGPASASFAVGMSVEQASNVIVAELTERGANVDRRADPSEDGRVVIQALGPEPPCEVQVRLTPLSGTTSMVVMYGAGCPFE
jgi:hypothetical protein